MPSRTALGTVKVKAPTTSVTLSSVACFTNDSIFVLLGWKGQTMPTSVKWGNRDLVVARKRHNATDDFSAAIFHARRILKNDTRDIVATWAANTSGKVLVALKVDTPYIHDNSVGSIQATTINPSVGPTTEHARKDNFVLCALVSKGPSGDTIPTLGGGFTIGQRDGTAGSPPTGNITVLEGYQFDVDSGVETLSGTGATSRSWTNVVSSFRPQLTAPWDKYGSEIAVGDTVLFNGNERVVNTLKFQRNIVDLAIDGWTSAVECEVIK